MTYYTIRLKLSDPQEDCVTLFHSGAVIGLWYWYLAFIPVV